MSVPAPALTVIYARDIDRVARFYERTLSLAVQEEEEGFVVLGNGSFEIAVVRMAAEAVHQPADPHRIRTGTPVKGSFLVESLEVAKAAADAAGGGTKPLSSAWQWRGQLHLDGHDPEGNVLQFRVGAA